MEEIQTDPESATTAAFLEWKYIPSGAERAQWDIFELELSTRRKKGQTPTKLTRPWEGKKTNMPDMVPVDSPERVDAIARLKALS